MILAGVHGDELCGVSALQEIFNSLEIERGTVLYGFGNPRAIATGKRFVEKNLNRMFKPDADLTDEEKQSYDYDRAQYLKKYFDTAEALLDIHSNPWREEKTFVICEKNGFELAGSLPTDIVVSGFDAAEPGGTDYYMNRGGKIGICFEAGYLDDAFSRATAKVAIENFLEARGHTTRAILPRAQKKLNVFKKGLSRSDAFVLTRPFANFEALKEGELIGTDGAEEVRAPRACHILFARNGKFKGDEIFLLCDETKPEW